MSTARERFAGATKLVKDGQKTGGREEIALTTARERFTNATKLVKAERPQGMQTPGAAGFTTLMAQKAAESPTAPLAVDRTFHPKASQVILRQSDRVNEQVKAAESEVRKDAREQDRAAGGYAAAFGGTKRPVDKHPVASTYAAARDTTKSVDQMETAGKETALGRLLDQQDGLARSYYFTENEEQRERISRDKTMLGKQQGVGDLQSVIGMAIKVAADAQNPGSGGEPAHIQQFKERLAREYGITDEAIRNYALYGDDDSVPADGKYTNISQFIHQLEREQQKLSDEMTAAGYDYNRMAGYRQWLKEEAEAKVRAEEREKAAKEDPGMASLGSVFARALQPMDYAGALLSGFGRSDPSKPKSYVPINPATMDTTNAVNTVRGTVAQMAEEKWGPVGSFAYQTGMSMADFLFTAGITGNFSGGGKLASNLSLGIMGSNAAADTTVSALNRGLSNRQALTLGAIAGVAEILTEKVSLETLLDKTSLNKSRLGYFLKNVIAEGSEEATSDVINWVADVLVSRDKSEWRQAIAAYRAKGMDENTAFWHALGDQAVEIGVDFLGGAVSGGVMAGGSVAIDMHYDRAAGRDFRQGMNNVDGVYRAAIDTGLESDVDSDSYRLAKRYQQQLDKKGELTDGQLGRLYRANIAAIEAEGDVDTPTAQNPVEGAKNARMDGDTVPERLAMMREHAQQGFGPSGETALLDIYDEKMAAEIDPAEAYGVFSRVYTATMMGQEATEVADAPKTLVEAAKIAAKYDLRAAQGTQQETQVSRSPGFNYGDAATRRFVSELPDGVEERMDAAARDLGLTIRAVDSVFGGQANAQIVGSEILIDENVTDGVSYILGHEFTHRVQELAETEYSDFQAALDQGRLHDTAEKIAAIYQEKGIEITETQAMDEATADMAGEMLQNGELLDEFINRNRGNKTLLQRVREVFHAIIDKLTGAEKRRAQSAEGKLTAALEAAAQNAQAMEDVQTEVDAGARFSIGYDVDNTPFVTVEDDILDGVPRAKWTQVVSENLKEKFPDGVKVGRNSIKINRQSRREMTHSEYTKWLRQNDRSIYADKFRATDNADEIIKATQGYINEGLKHERKDNIKDFARGTVLLRIGGADYSAEVIVGTTSSGEMLLYDIVNMKKTQITEKDDRTIPPNLAESDRSGAIASNENVSQDGGDVKPNYSLKGTEHAERMVELERENVKAVEDVQTEADAEARYSLKESRNIYDYSKPFEKQLEDFEAGRIPKNDTLMVRGTPKVFQQIGLLSLPMTMNQTHINYALNGTRDIDHFLGKEGLLQLPEALEHPIAIISSKTKAGNSLVAILEVRQNGKQVIVPVVVDGFGFQNGIQIDSNALTSAYGKNYSISRVLHDALENEANGVPFSAYYVDTGKATELFRVARVPMPKMPKTSNSGFIHSITEAGSPVKRRLGDVTKTQQFKRWFGDWQNDPAHASKVVDSEGKPLVVYHGTLDKGITAFNKEFIGSRYSADDVGFFFTDKESIAEDYAHSEFNADRVGEVIPAYLDIKKPLVVDTKYVRENGYGNIFKDMDSIDAWDAYQGAFLEAAEEMGADGILVKDGESTMAVVFEPTQIKSATDNIGTFDKENPDIRFSLKGTEHAERMVELEKENAALQAKYEQARKQTRRSDAGKVSEAQVGRYAKVLMDHVGVKGDAKALGLKLQTMYDAVASGKDLDGAEFTYKDFRQMANDIAGDLVSRAVLQDNTMYEDYAALRAHIRDTRIVVDAETRENITDYADFRKRNMGRLRLAHGETGNIDLVYNELSREYPGLFPEDLAYGQDQLERIAEVMEQIYDKKEFNPWAGDIAKATQGFANEIMEEFWTLPGQEATFADRQWRQREALKRRHMAEIQDAVRAEREKGKVREQKLKQWFKDKAAEQRAYKAESEARNRLLKLAARMKRMPVDNTNKTLIRELVGDLDTEARHLTGKKLTELTELRRYVEGKADPNSDIYDPDFILDQRTADNLKRLEMKHIDDMTLQDVKDLTQVLLNLENEIRTSKRLIGQEEARDVYQLGEQTVKDLRSVKGSKATGVSAALDKHIITETLSPIRQVRRMVGYKADSPLVKLTEGLADGQRRMMDYQMRAGKPFERFAKDENFTKGFSGKDAKTVKITGWVRGKLQEVEITPAMRVSLWLHSQNDQNALHMRDGGIRVPDLGLYRKGKLADAYAAGTVVKLSPDMAKNLWEQMTQTERAFAREVQKYFREVSQPAINEVSRQLKGYDIAEVESYYPIRTDKTFGKTELETLKFDGTIEGMGFLKERQSFAHNPMYLEDVNTVVEQAIRMHGKYVGLAIPVRNFGKVWNVSTAVQTENGEWVSYGDSVQNAVQAVWGKAGYDYITKMMTDLQGGGKQASNWAKTLNKVRSNYAGAVLTLNASVAMKQAASYPTAAAVLGWGPLMKAMGDIGRVDLDLIAKYTPLQWYRSQGFSTKELGDIQNYGGLMKEVLGKKGLNWIQGIDLATTRKLWKASEYYIRDNSPSLKVGSEEYYRAVADIYNRVIEETQPNYTTMQRPQLLRSDDTLMGNLAMFKTQPFQNFNILYDAAGEYRAVMERAKAGEATKAEIKTAKTNLSRAVTSQVGQLAVFAAMTMVWAMFRGRKDKYEDDEGNVTLWSGLGGLGKDMLSGTAAMVPFGTEVYEFGSSKLFGERYYGMEPVTIEAIGNAVSSLSKLGDTIWGTAQSVLKGEDVDWKGMLYQMDDSADDISKVAGLPYENVMNLFNGVARWALIGAKGKYLGEYAALHLTVDKEKNSKPYMDLLYKSMENDREAYDAMWSQMVKDGFDQKKIKDAMEKRMKDAQGVTKVSEMEERYISPDDREDYERAIERLTGSKLGKKATEQQMKDAKADAYKFATRSGGETDQARWDRWEAAGMDAGMYALYQLAEEMADKPNENGNLGTITNEEREAAIRSLGLSRRDSAAMWVLAGGNEKSNPWR